MISDFLRFGVALVRALVLFPFYYLLLSTYALWPWRLGAPLFLVRDLAFVKAAPQAAMLRLSQLRLYVRLESLVTNEESATPALVSRRVRRWFVYPFLRTIPDCARLARTELERLGASGSLARWTLFLDSLVDGYKYGSGIVSRQWFDCERRDRARFHIPHYYHIWCSCYLLSHKLNPELPRNQKHHDKTELFEACRKNGWPTVPVHASFVSGQVSEHEPIRGRPLLSKPATLTGGKGHFERWWPAPEPSGSSLLYRADDGSLATVQDIFDHVAAWSLDAPYLLQELITSHEDIRKLSGGNTLCTLRLPTCRIADGRVELLPLAYLRVPTKKDMVSDNTIQGSVAYFVNANTGHLEAGAMHGSYEKIKVHPTTSVEAVGFRLPFWQEAVDLCKTVHGIGFSNYPSVGWDVALTDEGPVLIEMNIRWASKLTAQLGETAYADCILSHMHELWPANCPETKGGVGECCQW